MRTTKQKINLILILTMLLTMAQTAMAVTEEVTETWTMNGSASSISGSTLSNGLGNRIVLSNGGGWLNNRTQTILDVNQALILTDQYSMEASFPDIEGTVTKVEFHNICLDCPTSYSMYVGKDMSNLLSISPGVTAFSSWDNAGQFKDVTYTGTLDVSSSAPLKLLFGASSVPPFEILLFDSGYIKVTYQREVAADPQHTFSFPNPSSFSGNTLTATCVNNSAGHECTLTNHQATLTLTAHDNTIESFPLDYPSLNLLEFNTQTGLGATAGTITYTNKTTGNSQTGMIFETGEFTASVTVTVGGNNYTLTKDFNILDGHKVNNNYSQFSLSKSSALEGEAITITYTQLMDEDLEGLTLTGATSGNNIAYTKSGNTYTFNMPAEDVNISAKITYPLNEDNITQSGDTYTIKNADGWDYFCRRMEVDDNLNGFSGKTVVLGDNITVTTSMAGSGKYPFKGTFDGDGHTLTFNHTASAPCSAPFQNTNGATIRNLHATGQIEGGIWNYIGGLVGSANGNLTIENCRVSTLISSTVSGTAFNGGFVGLLSSQYNQCHITGCVFDGLIYNPDYASTTYGCGGFIGSMSQYGYAILKDCLFLRGQYDNNNGKCELKWGSNDQNSTFFHRSNNYGGGTLTNCFYVGTRGLKQGSPAVESATAPTNFAHFGTPIDHRFLKVYGHTMVFGGKYYTPIYGDLVETYDYSGVKDYNIEYDDAPLGIPDITSPLWTECLTYNRSFTAGKPVTVMLPFNFKRDRITLAGSNENPSGKFYEFKGIEENQDHKWVAVMIEAGGTLSNEVVENTLQANHPYLYVPGESTKYWDTYVSGGINIFTQDNGGGNKVTPYDGWELRGTYTEKVWEENDPEIGKAYLIGDGGELIPVTAGTKIRPTECYIIQTKKRMDGKDITVSIPAVEWTGSEVAFDASAVKVWDGTTLLTKTTDYTVTAPTGTLQDTGDYPVTITGAGEYIGTKEAMFTIKGAPITIKNEANEDVSSVENAYTITTDQRGGATLTLVTPEPATPETPPTIVPIDIPKPVEVDHVDLDRIFEAGKACTLYLPFSIAASKVSGGTFYTFTTVNESTTPWSVEYNEVTGDIVANTPYIFLPNGMNSGKIVVDNGNNKVSVCTAGAHTTENGLWEFIGTYEPIKWLSDNDRAAEIGKIYGFAAEEATVGTTSYTVGQFVKIASGASIKPMRAYLKRTTYSASRGLINRYDNSLPSAMTVVLKGSNGDTTEIGTIRLIDEAGEWYSLDGRKLSGKPTKKGLYINCGKKVVIK